MNYLKKELYELVKSDESFFDFVQNACSDGVWYLDLEQPENEWMSPKFWTTLGYDPNEFPHKSASLTNILNSDDGEAVTVHLLKHLADPDYPFDQVVRYKHKNGSTVWIRCRGFALRDKDGKPIRLLGSHTDITAERRKEELLLETNKVANIGGWEIDLISNRLTWTEITKEIHECPQEYIPDLNTAVIFYKEGENRDKIIEALKQAIETGKPFDIELKIITAKGNERWVRSKGEVQMVEGKSLRVYGIFQNIHEQKLKDIQLAQSEEQFRLTFDNAAIGMALVATDGKWLKVNKSLCRIVGYTPEELVLLTFQDITHPDDLATDLGLLQELIDGKTESYQMEKRYFTKQGNIVWVLLAVSVVRNQFNQPIHFISQIKDISERKHTEQIVREERTLLKTLIDNIPINIFLKDSASRKTLINRREMEYCGAKSEEEVLGKDDFELYPAGAARISIEEDRQIFASGKPMIDKEVNRFRNDGTNNWFLTSKIPIRDEQNNITSILGFSYDITERKEIEERLRTLVEVTSEQNMRLLNFAHIVSHNLRSHAQNFSMLLSLLVNETDENEKILMFNMLKNASDSLTETVHHLNEVVAINVNVNENSTQLNLHDGITNAQVSIKALIRENNVHIINAVPHTLTVKAVPAYLESILLNFLTNAIKYKSPQREPVIIFSTVKENDYLVLSIEDNGLGIDLIKYKSKLFGMYKTFHGNKDARGLGLFITKNQIEAMRGKIEVESTPGTGTKFKIYLYEKN